MTISPGKYKARATEGALGVASTGREQVAIAFSIVDGEHAGETLTYFGYFTDATADRTIESLRHCGWIGDDLSDLTGILDNEVEIVVADEEYNGAWQTKIKWINKPGTGLALKERLDPAAAKAFAASMRGRVIAQKAKGGQPMKAATRPANGASRGGSSSRGSASADPLAGADMGDNDDYGF